MLNVSISTEPLETRLRERAVVNGHSPEKEAQDILAAALVPEAPATGLNLGQAIHQAFAELGGVELDLDWLRKQPSREPSSFD